MARPIVPPDRDGAGRSQSASTNSSMVASTSAALEAFDNLPDFNTSRALIRSQPCLTISFANCAALRRSVGKRPHLKYCIVQSGCDGTLSPEKPVQKAPSTTWCAGRCRSPAPDFLRYRRKAPDQLLRRPARRKTAGHRMTMENGIVAGCPVRAGLFSSFQSLVTPNFSDDLDISLRGQIGMANLFGVVR